MTLDAILPRANSLLMQHQGHAPHIVATFKYLGLRLRRSPLRKDLHVDPVGILDVQPGIGVVFRTRTTLCHIACSRFLAETGYPDREVIHNSGRALMIERDQRPGIAEANNSVRLVLADYRE